MRVFGVTVKLSRQPRALREKDILPVLAQVVERLEVVEKKAEATRQKVYRDGKAEEASAPVLPSPPSQPTQLKAGDPVPDWMP